MRLQLAIVAILLATAAATAHADGTLAMRGVYYKERSTRVVQPMLDGMFEVGARGLVTGHMLVDAITSASASSGAASSQPFTERRLEAGAGYAQEIDGPDGTFLDVVRLGADTKVSKEPDYRSVYVGLRGEAEMVQKNLTFGLGGGVSLDEINNEGAQSPMGGPRLLCDNNDTVANATACPLNTYSMFTSVSQIVSRNAVVGISYDIAKLHGFTSNAYRQVFTASGPFAEKHPNDRLRQAVAVSGRYFFPKSRTTAIAAYRYYFDDWDIHAHTPELRIIQEVGDTVDATIRYRYYTQDAAFFWMKHYPDQTAEMMSKYLTDDPKMTAFTGHLMEAKLGLLGETFGLEGRWAGARLEGILEYIVQNNRFGNAVVAHASLTVPFEY